VVSALIPRAGPAAAADPRHLRTSA